MDYQQIQRYLPSKRVRIVAAIAVFGFLVFVGIQNRQAITRVFESKNTLQDKKISALKKADTDNDGLSNWEEKLWGTKKDVADTDDDGTSDGKEVKNNSNPDEAGPNDKIAEAKISSSGTSTTKNLTREITSQVVPRAVKLAAAKQSGSNITKDELNFARRKIQQQVDVQGPKVSSRSDLQITAKRSPQRVRQYFDRFNNAVQVIKNQNQTSPLKVVAKAQQEGKLGQVNLNPYIRRHKKAVTQLRTITVPKPFMKVHLKSLQSLERGLYALRKLNNIDTDPIGAIIGAKEYKKSIRLDREATKLLIKKVKKYGQSIQ